MNHEKKLVEVDYETFKKRFNALEFDSHAKEKVTQTINRSVFDVLVNGELTVRAVYAKGGFMTYYAKP